MELNANSLKPIFVQIAEWVEDQILKGNIVEGDKVPSQIELSKAFSVNPLTAGKGVALLEERGIVVKRRGLGMFVAGCAKDRIYEFRRNRALASIIGDLLDEAEKLDLSKEELFAMIERFWREHETD